jgi:hypothetical protein
MVARTDHTGNKYNYLTAIKFDHYDDKSHSSMWLFLCDCGNEKVLSANNVRTGHTKSCGCYNSKVASARMKTHGRSKTREYDTWLNMNRRCRDKNNTAYKNYGGRGINVCDSWRESFENFLNDMGKAPSSKHTIDRINNDGGYGPENCRWATREQQNNNYSRNIFIDIDGKRQSLKKWCDELGLLYQTTRQRIKTLGWTPEEALGFKEPANRRNPHNKRAVYIEIDGVRKPLEVWGNEYNIPNKILYKRIFTHKWPYKQALGIEPRVTGDKRK